ncbi:DUF551 domain-containing protein, partial [Klebsiella pneumoniae]
QHNQYTTAAKQMLGVMAESAWKAATERQRQKQSVSVPDVKMYEDVPYEVGRFKTHRDCYCDGWNACRAAMLAAAPQPAVESDFIPKNLDKALGVLGMAIPESREEFNFQTERWIQRLIDRVIRYADEFQGQPAPVVPEDVLAALQKVARIRLDLNDFDGDCRGIADCLCDAEEALIEVVNRRAAMLASSTQSPGSETATVPGKWIPVSERMPIEFEAVIAFDGDQVYGEAMYSSDDGFTIDGYDPCDRVQLQNVTHWMPLPAAPQEVKSES